VGGVNISEDARHWIRLLQYNPSTTHDPDVQVSQLAGRPVSLVEFSPELPTTLLTVHGPSPDQPDVRYAHKVHIYKEYHCVYVPSS
jgi:hypothetical protein